MRARADAPEREDGAAVKRRTITGLERALLVFELFAEAGGKSLGITEIAKATGLSKAVVHRILTTFSATGFIEFDPNDHRYSLGPKVLLLGLHYLNNLDVQDLARRDTLPELSRRTQETATLSIRSGWTRAYVDQVTPARDVKMVVELGRSFPLHAGASSKAFLAFMPLAEVDDYLAHHALEPVTKHTITDVDELRAELAVIRQRGYAISTEERQAGAGSAAAPIFRHDGQPVAAISVCGPVERFESEVDSLVEAVMDLTTQLSYRLGFQQPATA